jgi:hypothetical protein
MHIGKPHGCGAISREISTLVLGKDIDDIRTRAGIERGVIDVLRRLGFVAPSVPAPRSLRLVKAELLALAALWLL